MRRQPAYADMIGLGAEIIPFLLEELGGEEYGISTQILLSDLTGADPTACARGSVSTGFVAIDVVTSAQLWREWGVNC